MHPDLSNHLRKCRCCFRSLMNHPGTVFIDQTIEKQFLNLVKIELRSSEKYSRTICEDCHREMIQLSSFQCRMFENQSRLYWYVENEEETRPEWDVDIKIETLSEVSNADSLQSLPGRSFDYFNENSADVHIKEEIAEPEFCDIQNQSYEEAEDEALVETPNRDLSARSQNTSENFFPGLQFFINDQMNATPTTRSQKTCIVCGKLVDAGTFNKHMKKHMTTRVKCPADGCDKDFTNKKALRYHTEARHAPQQKLHCPQCNAEFSTKTKVKRHIYRQHTASPLLCQVPDCNHSTKRKEYLAMHYRNHKDLHPDQRAELLLQLKNKNNLSFFFKADMGIHETEREAGQGIEGAWS